MNMMSYYREMGLSMEATDQINKIIGVIMASHLSNKDKTESIEFMRHIEEYFDGEKDEDGE